MARSLGEIYEVAEGVVTLTIIVGNAQIGASHVKLDNESLWTGEVSGLSIGRGPEIVGKILSIKTVVTDVNDKTNRTNVRYVLEGGKTHKKYDLEEIVQEEGASIIYRARFELKA